MRTEQKKIGTGEKISILWILVMFAMAFADILTFVLPESLNELITGTMAVIIRNSLLFLSLFFLIF